MFPEEIKVILEKYQDDNIQQIKEINKNTSDILQQLKEVRKILSTKMSTLIANDSFETINEIINDSKVLLEFINNASFINVIEDIQNVEFSQEIIPTNNIENSVLYYKPVRLYLCSDNVCPNCGCNMEVTSTSYTYLNNNEEHKGRLSSYKCETCGRFFVTDYELENLNIDNTNIKLSLEFYDKILLSDTVYVVNNINSHSNLKHTLSDKMCILTVINDDGNPIQQPVMITFCKDCNKLYMLKSAFDNLVGVPTCIIIDETTKSYNSNSDSYEYNGEALGSKLTRYGYNVNCIDKLTTEQRRKILTIQLVSQNIEKNEIISIIESDIQRSITSMQNGCKRDLSQAISKWESDKNYVENLVIDKAYQYIDISRIILQYTR